MCSKKDVAYTKWTFEIVDGPTEAEIILLAIRRLLRADHLSMSARFMLKINQKIWVNEKIIAEIVELDNLEDGQWSFLGKWTEAKFRERPLYFRAMYRSSRKTGEMTFSFEYGKWPEEEEEYDGAV